MSDPTLENINANLPPLNTSTGAVAIPQSSARGRKIAEWMRWSAKPESTAENLPITRPRRDSSTLSADEALNISRANAAARKPDPYVDTIKENIALPGSSDIPIPQRKRSDSSKYNSLGLITAFSGGPGSF